MNISKESHVTYLNQGTVAHHGLGRFTHVLLGLFAPQKPVAPSTPKDETAPWTGSITNVEIKNPAPTMSRREAALWTNPDGSYSLGLQGDTDYTDKIKH